MIDGEQAINDKLPLVLVADQRPFSSGGNRFCILQPLMTLDGDPLDTSVAAFPNRGRVWWMLRDNIREEDVVPGSIWISTLEDATKFDLVDPESDKYQVLRSAIQLDSTDLAEVIPLDTDHPDLLAVTRGRRLPFSRRPVSTVFLRGRRTALGPLKAAWHQDSQEIELQPLSLSKPEVIRVATELFDQSVRMSEFTVSLNSYDPHHEPVTQRIFLTRKAWWKLDELRRAGETLDASLDSQIINWALKRYGITRSQGQQVKTFFNEVGSLEAAGDDDEETRRKLLRLQGLAADAERVLALGGEVAVVLAQHGEFRQLVESHIDALAESRVQEEVRLRRSEVETAITDQRRQLQAVESDLRRRKSDFELLVRQQDEDFQRRQASRLEGLEQREQEIAEREQAIVRVEAGIQQRLDSLIRRFETEADKLTGDVLIQWMLLRKSGALPSAPDLAGSSDWAAVGGSASREATLNLPAYLTHARPAGDEPEMLEDEFLRQFARVVQQRGFQFDIQDLKNFHTCVKIGGLTVLAGASGTGKSSLPQLYAESLGWADRYLHVSVRPDWLDDRDFVGAYNPLVQRFEPSNSGVIDRLVAAAVDRQRGLGGVYLIALDEMNLARVEHYFAQFLSLLELTEDKRKLSLVAPGLAQPSDPYHPFHELPIGNNVRFVGTVNIDETTHFFSPKVLDRTQVVCLPPPDLASLQAAQFSDPIPGIRPVAWELFQRWAAPTEPPPRIRQFLLQVSEALQESRLGLRARQFQRIAHYVACSQNYLEQDAALDYQLMQVVLPRLRRTAPRLDACMQKLRALVLANRFPRSAEMLKRIAEPGIENDFFQLL